MDDGSEDEEFSEMKQQQLEGKRAIKFDSLAIYSQTHIPSWRGEMHSCHDDEMMMMHVWRRQREDVVECGDKREIFSENCTFHIETVGDVWLVRMKIILIMS